MRAETGLRPKILVVEDEKDVKDLMLLHLKRDGLEAWGAEDGEEALKLISQNPFDLIVLDWMLPGVSGLDICKKMSKTLPILMVTARADPSDIVLGLEMGAYDYITKPFDIPVFLARVRTLLRRTESSHKFVPKDSSNPAVLGNDSKITIGHLTINTLAYQVFCQNTEIQLTPSEFKLLTALASHQGRVLSREKLIELVQGEGVIVVDRAIDTHVFGLRKKLGACAGIIETIRGVGYRILSHC